MEWFSLLEEIIGVPGPTGQEEAVMDWCANRWEPRCEQITRTPTGNLYAKVGGSGRKVLIQAHADEIGFVVKAIDTNGFLRLATAQRMDDPGKRFPVGQPALVLGRNGPVDGLIATATGHVLTEAQRKKSQVEYDDIWVDIGVENREDAERAGIHPGARVIWNPPLRQIGNRIYGKAMDDRMLLALMTAVIESVDDQELTCELHLGVTIQEENGLIGANAMHLTFTPDVAIALDVGLAGDIPSVSEHTMPTKLGNGPVIVHKDASAHYTRSVVWSLIDCAEKAAIPYQHAIFDRFGSDGSEFIRHGIPAALIGPPTRYTHSPFEMIDQRDLDHTTDLVRAFVTQ